MRVRHINLSNPEHSAALQAPLAQSEGGWELCKEAGCKPVFASKEDPDYQKILAMCTQGKTELERVKRFDMPGFVPPNPNLVVCRRSPQDPPPQRRRLHRYRHRQRRLPPASPRRYPVEPLALPADCLLAQMRIRESYPASH